MKILAVNPGSTSTKIGLFEDNEVIFRESIEHDATNLEKYASIYEQTDFRKQAVLDTLAKYGINATELSAVVGRGGLLPPVKSGGYVVNDAMLTLINSGSLPEHASNLGAVIADAVAKPLGIPSYIYDAVSADELLPVAAVTGLPEITRHSFCHVLNSRAMARRFAESQGKKYEDMQLLVAHLGGGISTSAHKGGKIVDSQSDDNGPFAPERAGSIPLLTVIEMCYSGEYTEKEMKKKIRGGGGLKALLGTPDCRKIEKMIADGDEKAELIYRAQAYQIAKGISILAVALDHIDAIILTGGIAHSKMLTDMVTGYVKFLAPVHVMAGEFELEALAAGALRLLKGEEQASVFA